MNRPTLADTVVALTQVADHQTPGLFATGLTVELPAEVAWEDVSDGQPALVAGPRRWRWPCDYEAPLGRLRVRYEAVADG